MGDDGTTIEDVTAGASSLGEGDYGPDPAKDANLTMINNDYHSELSMTSTSVTTTTTTTATIINPSGDNPTGPEGTSNATTTDNAADATLGEKKDVTTTTTKKETYHWTSQHFELAVPALIGMLADPLLSLMDTAYVGRVGPTELAALGACTSIFHLAFNAFRATTTATTSLVGNATPTTDTDDDPRPQIVQISLSLGVVLGLLVLCVLRSAGPWALNTMGVPMSSSLFEPAMAYLSARLWAAPAVLFIVVAEGAFRGFGDTKIPLLASLVAAAINFVLDPLLMFSPGDRSGIPGIFGWGTRGAAAATALSQLGAAAVYFAVLIRRRMLPEFHFRSALSSIFRFRRNSSNTSTSNAVTADEQNPTAIARPSSDSTSKMTIIKTILGANLAMVMKQGSLLLAWAYATARATRIGNAHVAAHQVALSCWLVFALMLDGAAVSAQVLMTRSLASGSLAKVRSLVMFMTRFSVIQGFATTGAILLASPYLPKLFTQDLAIRGHLTSLMPQLAWQQLLVSLTLVSEALAIGGNQFQLLAIGTTISTIFSMNALKQATTVVDIWSKGIVSLFVGRLITALIGIARVMLIQRRKMKEAETNAETE